MPSPNINQKIRLPHENAPPAGATNVDAAHETVNGVWRYLRGNVHVETSDMLLEADEIDWNTESGDVEARGHVHYVNFNHGETLDCDRAEYNMDQETGVFYNVSGTSQSQVQARPGLLTTQNPFYFQAKWAERVGDRYILHDGFMTDCLLPNPWWILRAPQFDMTPGDNAVAHHAWFYLKNLPVFYVPWFYKSLKKEPRKSGFLLPEVGNSSLHGKMVGFGYYWAISPSMDLTYRGLYYTSAGLANLVELRGKFNQNDGFDLNVFGVDSTQTAAYSSSGLRVDAFAKYTLGNGWQAIGQLDYLSSFAFIQDFTQSFNEAVFSETQSVAFLTKHWNDLGVYFAASRDVDFQSTAPGDTIEVRKMPSAEVNEREHQLNIDNWPVWVSFDGSAGLLDRTEPLYETARFVDRLDFAPKVSTAFRWHDIQIIPTFGLRETQYGESLNYETQNGETVPVVSGSPLLRNERDVTVDLVLPALERVFDHPPKWMGQKVKHVIEPRVTYKYVDGIDNFNDIIRFDSTDIFANTNQVEFSLTNRLLAKDKNGTITDFLTWQVRWDRYFDPTFGGAVIPGQRNVIWPEIDLTGFDFLDGPRTYSPISSEFRVQSRVNFEWRLDYDPLTKRIANSSVQVDGRIQKWFWAFGHTDIDEPTVLEPRANQLHSRIGYGNPNSRGWNSGLDVFFNLTPGPGAVLPLWDAQVTYNTDCCGFSVQYRRFNIGLRDDSQWQGSFAISNIGTFGTLKRQQSIF
ncbi:MAG TPA: LPS assembly protein LptD [Bryobacteraceae bacterium]|nr:LPS assembly protein LptD [Bryobacteraceae bacterium]